MSSNTTFDGKTTGTEVAQAYASNAKGKTVLVTGVTLGSIGEATARAFAHGGAATVIITGRSDEKLSAAEKELSAAYPDTRFRPLKLDLNSLAAVQKSAQEILDDTSLACIDILVANAGINTFHDERSETADGLEIHLGVNHVAHHLFTTALLPKLRAAAQKNAPGETRVITVSSNASIVSPFRFSDWNVEGKETPEEEQPNYGFMEQVFRVTLHKSAYSYHIGYGQSKTANILFAIHLNKLLAQEGIYAFSLHPGLVGSVGGKRGIESGEIPAHLIAMIGEPKTLDQGSATTLVAALDPKLNPSTVFLNDAQVSIESAPPYALDEKAAEKLWKLTEGIIQEKLKR